ncbi:hypothetical protein C0J52_24392 [Blattella germanica]|nr:hypothetical protein C0J52_24392 [Blattella germanica]
MNTQEFIRVFACSTVLTYNLTKTHFDLTFRPFAEAILNIKADANEVKDTIKSVKGMLIPIAEEIEGDEEMRKIREDNEYIDQVQNDSSREQEIKEKYKENTTEKEDSRFEKRYLRKMAERCEDILSRSVGKCRKMFQETYEKCTHKVSWMASWILCWPMKLTFVCNIVEAMGGNKPCDPQQVVEPGFGEGYEYLKLSKKTLTEEFKSPKLQYKVPHIPKLIDVREAMDTAKGVINDFERKKVVLETILIICSRLLAFLFIIIIINAQRYHDNYLSDIEFDNIYITRYFRKIDARRHKRGEHALLPLKKAERSAFINPSSILLHKLERKKVLRNAIKIILIMVTAIIFIIIDRVLYEGLDLVKRHARIQYTQEGSHDLILKIKGTGMIANLVRSIFGGFNIRKRVKSIQNNEACLPRPIKLQNYYIYKIIGTYVGIWLLAITQGYTQRFRRAICGWYYPKREKRRVLFLYNETLKRRRGLFRFMRAKVIQRAREKRLEMQANILVVMQVKYAHMCSWVRCFPAARRKCLICEEREPKKWKGTFVECPNPICHFIYCAQCWTDIKEICYACNPDESGSDEDEPDML